MTISIKPGQASHQELTNFSSSPIPHSPEQENNVLITLLVISESADLTTKLQLLCSGLPARCIVQDCLHNPKLIVDKLEYLQPDLILVDTAIIMDGYSLTEWLRAIRAKDVATKIILLQDREVPNLINTIIKFNVSGLIPSSADYDVFRKAICVVHRGELWMPHLIIRQVFTYFSEQYLGNHSFMPNDTPLSLREQSITEFVAQGLTNKEIAKQFNISPETIKKHLKNIFHKIGARKRSELASKYATTKGRT